MRYWIGLAAIGIAAALPLQLDPMGYPIRVLTLAMLFAALGQAWNIVGGLANQISLAMLLSSGSAPTPRRFLINYGISPWLGMVAGAAVASWRLLLSFPTMRLRDTILRSRPGLQRVLRSSRPHGRRSQGPSWALRSVLAGQLVQLQFRSTLPYYYIILAALVLVSVVFSSFAKVPRLPAARGERECRGGGGDWR